MRMGLVFVLILYILKMSFLWADPLLVITIMVKDEAAVIRQTLQPYIDAGMSSFLVYDTGSTDGTPNRARELFKECNGTEAYVIEEPFVDFATSRNRALELTYQQFPTATFVLMIDAEWYMHNVDQLLHFCRGHMHNEEAVYLIRIVDERTAFYAGRLIRCSARPWFERPVHEQLTIKASVCLPESIYFEYRPSSQGSRRTKERWERDAKLLLQEIADHPDDTRTLFYLAQTMAALQKPYEAYQYYALCANGESQDELIYLAHYRLGNIAEFLMATDPQFNWIRAMRHYLDAFSCRPHRAEPLVAIAQHYWNTQEMDLCFLFSRRAAELPYPPDYFCVEQDVYSFMRYNLLGASAGRIGQMTLGKWAVCKALERHPDVPHLLQNLAEYERLEKQGTVT